MPKKIRVTQKGKNKAAAWLQNCLEAAEISTEMQKQIIEIAHRLEAGKRT